MEKFFRVIRVFLLVVGLPAACSYEVYSSSVSSVSSDNIGWYIAGVIFWIIIVAIWYIKNQGNQK